MSKQMWFDAYERELAEASDRVGELSENDYLEASERAYDRVADDSAAQADMLKDQMKEAGTWPSALKMLEARDRIKDERKEGLR